MVQDRAQDRNSDTPGIPKNASDPIGIPLKMGAPGNKPSSSEEGESLGVQPPEARGAPILVCMA